MAQADWITYGNAGGAKAAQIARLREMFGNIGGGFAQTGAQYDLGTGGDNGPVYARAWANPEFERIAQAAGMGNARSLAGQYGLVQNADGSYRFVTGAMADPEREGKRGAYILDFNPDGTVRDVTWDNHSLHKGFIGENLSWLGPAIVGGAALAGTALGGGAAASSGASGATGGIGGLVDGSTSLLGLGGGSVPASTFGQLTGLGAGGAAGAMGAGGVAGSVGAAAAGGSGMWSLLSNPQTWLSAGQLVSGFMGADAARDASRDQVQAAREANDLTLRMFEQNRADMEPWRQVGIGALGQLVPGMAPGGEFNRGFTLSDFVADPGYQFRVDEGKKALENSAAARGGLLSGNTLRAITQYGQDMGSQEFGNAYNRWNNDMTSRFNRLSSLAGTGQTATRDVATMGSNAATQVGANTVDMGNARAAGRVGATNALTNTLGNLQSMYTLNQLLAR